MNDEVVQQLVQTVNTILNPNSTPDQRATAHSICESCKENEMCGQIGYNLASNKTMEPQIKQFGLQLMQYFIHKRWVHSSQEEQMQVKDNAMTLLENCGRDECCYVKDGISHVITEIAKQVWPQQWPTMVQDLIKNTRHGPVQTELVELIFLRLAEDVAVLQNIAVGHRSRDIRQGLSLSMEEILGFFFEVLDKSYVGYTQLLGTLNASELVEMKMYSKLVCCTLKTLQGFLEWINVEHIFCNDGALIKALCKLLDFDGLKVLAAECLVLIASRKGKPEKKYLLKVSTPEYTNAMLKAIQQSVERAETEEEQYMFLKRMGNLFATLANQIFAAWPDNDTVSGARLLSDLASHDNFLEIMLAFLEHENHVISSTVSQGWVSLLRHRDIRKDLTLQKYVPRLFEIAVTRVCKDAKYLLPVYAQLDFNDEAEMETFTQSSRVILIEMVRWCTRSQPLHCISVTLQWLSTELSSPLDFGTNDKGIKLESCSKSSPTYIRWHALSSIFDVVLGNVVLGAKERGEESKLPIAEAENILCSLLDINVTDVLLCQCLLGFINSFLKIMEMMTEKMSLVVRILAIFVKFINQTQESPDRWKSQVKLLRRYSLCAIVHLCKYHSALILGINQQFKTMMMKLVDMQPEKLAPLEKVQIFEALVLVSGEWNIYEDQAALIGEIMKLSNNLWPPKDSLKSPMDFALAIGLSRPPAEYDSGPCYAFRSNLSFCISLTMAMMNRARIPSETDIAEKGGFIDSMGNLRNPCAQHLLPVLEHIVLFTNMFQGLWTVPVKAVIHSDMIKSLDVKESEKNNLIAAQQQASGTKDPDEIVNRIPWQQMQNFLILNLENCYQILGGIGRCGPQVYSTEELFPSVLAKVFQDLQTLPQLRLKTFIRQFLYYFLKYCPQNHYHSVAAPLLLSYCSFMNSMLTSRWDQYGSREQERLRVVDATPGHIGDDVSEREEEEIYKEQLLRAISREYLEMLVNLCVVKKSKSKNGPGSADAENHPADVESQEDVTMTTNASNVSQLTDLGLVLMESEVSETLLTSALAAICWHDTMTAFKAVQMIWAILKNTIVRTPNIPSEGANFLFESLLRGLQRHGRHDGCQAQLVALALFTFVHLRPHHPSLTDILHSIPAINKKALHDFDSNYGKYAEKKRKLSFKKLVNCVIEQHVGQRFKVRQEMQLLPRIFSHRDKPKKCKEIDAGSLGLEFFFKP